MLRQLHVGGIGRNRLPAQGKSTDRIRSCLRRDRLYNTSHVGIQLGDLRNFGTAYAGNQYPDIVSLRLENLFNMGHDAHTVQILQLGFVHHDILLGNQQNILILLHGSFQSTDGLGSANIKMNGLIRKNRQPPKG